MGPAAQNNLKRPSGETIKQTPKVSKKTKPEPAAAPDSFTASELAKAKKSLISLVARTIKKTPHSRQKKGRTSVVLGVQSRQFGLALLGNHGVTASSTKQMEKREFYSHEDVAAWLGLTENAGRLPCKFDGKFWQIKGIHVTLPQQYAAFETFDVCIKTKHIKINMKTVLAGGMAD